MNIGEKIKQIRTEKDISVEHIASKLGVSKTTIYRYEDSSIEKIPVSSFDQICKILGVTPAELIGNHDIPPKNDALPLHFETAEDAMEFLVQTPILAAYGGYTPEKMDDNTLKNFANEILQQFQLVSYKYKNQ